MNVNAYHQPGVEAGKKAAAAVIDLQKSAIGALQSSGLSMSIEALANELGRADAVETLYRILRHLDANDRWVVLEGDRSRPGQLQVRLR